MTGEWIRLECGNDWGNRYLAIKALTPDGFASSASQGLKLAAGDPVTVRWPDGTEQATEVVARPYREQVYDMGHEYGVEGNEYGIMLRANGIESFVGLHEVEVQREWAESKLKARP